METIRHLGGQETATITVYYWSKGQFDKIRPVVNNKRRNTGLLDDVSITLQGVH